MIVGNKDKNELFIALINERGLLRNTVYKVRLIGGRWVDLENNLSKDSRKYITMYYGHDSIDNEAKPLEEI